MLYDEQYFDLTNSLQKNSMIVGNNNISLNEIFVADLDCQRFDKYYANCPTKEIIKVLEFMKGNGVKTLDNHEEQGLYRTLKNINDQRTSHLNDFDKSLIK